LKENLSPKNKICTKVNALIQSSAPDPKGHEKQNPNSNKVGLDPQRWFLKTEMHSK